MRKLTYQRGPKYPHLLRKVRREVACLTDTNSKVELILDLNSPSSQLRALSTILVFPKSGIFTIEAIENFRWYMVKHFCV